MLGKRWEVGVDISIFVDISRLSTSGGGGSQRVLDRSTGGLEHSTFGDTNDSNARLKLYSPFPDLVGSAQRQTE